MGIVHRATMSPSKQELVESWLPTRSWADGHRIVDKVAEYRFDDPAGEVGVETILWRTEFGLVLQTPLTYRDAPLGGADQHLIGTTQHSVLGQRWVYDGCGDPVWAATQADGILSGASQSPMFFEDDGQRTDIPARMQVRGSGADWASPTVDSVDDVSDRDDVTTARIGSFEIALARVVGAPLGDGPHLSGSTGEPETTVLAVLRRS